MRKKSTFSNLIKGPKPILFDFSAEWCGPCRAMAPILKEVVADIGERARIVKVDIDQNRQLVQKLGIMGVPTFILFQNGEAKWRESGMQSANDLKQVLEKAIDNQL